MAGILGYAKYLAKKAMDRQLVTYQEFADEFGIGSARATSGPLNQVLRWTKSKGLPPLNAIVVSKSGGKAEYISSEDEFRATVERVFEYPWDNIFKNI